MLKNRHLVLFYGRTGSTLVDNHITQNICNPEFNFWKHGMSASEIHPGNVDAQFLYLMKLTNVFGLRREWCVKYHITTGVKITDDTGRVGLIGDFKPTDYLLSKTGEWLADREPIFDLSGTDRFLSELNVTDLHFSFRIDTVDTICSYLIAQKYNTWVVVDNIIKEHPKLKLEPSLVRKVCVGNEMLYKLYNEYVKRYKDSYNCIFYPYENLHEIFDTENDHRGMKKQLTKEQKQELIINVNLCVVMRLL